VTESDKEKDQSQKRPERDEPSKKDDWRELWEDRSGAPPKRPKKP
jgi:hypothetical protein